MQTIKWGIMGTGRIAKQFASIVGQLEHTEIIAVGSRNINTANQFKDQFQIKNAYSSYEELVKDQEVDMVYIATPHRYHYENAILCMNHQKGVLCEKPLTVNNEEAIKLYEGFKNKGLFLMEAMKLKFNPTVQKVVEWINEGQIGDVRLLQANFCFKSPFNEADRLYNSELAGGSLLDVGIYPITLATMIFGTEPIDIVSNAYIGKSNVDEQASYILNYGEGRQAVLTSAISLRTDKVAVIYGTKGKIEVPNFTVAKDAHLYKGNDVISFKDQQGQDDFVYEVEEVNHCIREKKMESNRLPVSDTIKILTLMDEIRRQWNFKYPFEK